MSNGSTKDTIVCKFTPLQLALVQAHSIYITYHYIIQAYPGIQMKSRDFIYTSDIMVAITVGVHVYFHHGNGESQNAQLIASQGCHHHGEYSETCHLHPDSRDCLSSKTISHII